MTPQTEILPAPLYLITDRIGPACAQPDSEKRVIAIYSAFCTDSNGELWHGAKVKTLIHECTHFTDTFNSDDIMYGNTESGCMLSHWGTVTRRYGTPIVLQAILRPLTRQ